MDLDAFFASVEQRDDPALRGKPVLVGGSRRRGVVAAASYEAREYGCQSAMPMAEALRRCPHAIVVRHSMDRYVEASREFMAILGRYSPDVEPLSLDEAFVDVTGCRRLFGGGEDIAHRIKREVTSELALVASVGVASNKFVAKVASDLDKPDGLTVVPCGQETAFLWPLPVSRLWGVGKVSQRKLAAIGIATIGDIAGFPLDVLASKLGHNHAAHLVGLAHGRDTRRVERHRHAVTIGHENTFEHDLEDREAVASVLIRHCERVVSRLRRKRLRCRSLVVKIKYADFRLITRQRSLAEPTRDLDELIAMMRSLLEEITIGTTVSTRVRLAGIAAANLVDDDEPQQLRLDQGARDQRERLGEIVDEIRDRFGASKIGRGV